MNLEITYRQVSALIPYANNARVHDAQNVGEIARSIQRFGFLDPVGIDQSGSIVWGHGRVLAAELIGLETVPTIMLPANLSGDEIKALRLAHNKLAEKSGWDNDLLRLELEQLKGLDFDLAVTGFDESEVDNLLRDFEQEFAAEPPRRVMPNITIEDPEEKDASVAPEEEEEEPEAEEEPAPIPKSSDDTYSQFSIVMQHENKLWLVDLLNKVRNAKGLDKIEDALVEIGRAYERNEE